MHQEPNRKVCGTCKVVRVIGAGNTKGGWGMAGDRLPTTLTHEEIFDIEIYFDGVGYLLCYSTADNSFYGDSLHPTELEAKESAFEDMRVGFNEWKYA
jgi:hypothetical protein